MTVLRAKWLCAIFALTICLPAAAQQISGTIAGTVHDSQQAAVTGARITLQNTTQGWIREAETNNEGIFLFTSLPPATYNVSVENSGFKKFEKRDLKIFANDRVNVTVILEVGSVTDTITIEATGGELQTTGADRSGVITGNQVVNLALTTRNFLDLMKTVPGVYYPPGGSGIGGFVNGGRDNQNNLTVDGVTNVDTGSNGGALSTLNIDQIAEFKVLTNSQPAEFGRSSGAQITLVTKGGSKDFHGTGYLFHRHEGLNANNWRNNKDGLQRPLYRNNFAGFNVGGPVLLPKWDYNRNRDKVFFFIGTEWQNQLEPNTLRNVTVPTALQRSGDFSQTRDGSGNLVTIKDPTTGLPFANGIIPASQRSADGMKILNFYPLPNASGVDYNYQTQVPNQFPRREMIYRGDWNINEKWRVYGRLLKTASSQNRAYGQWNADYNIPYAPMNFGNPGWSVIANATTVVNPTLTNEFIFGSSKNVLNIDPVDDTFKRSKLGLNYKMPFQGDTLDLIQNWRWDGVPNAPFTGFNGTPFRNFNHTYDITDNVTKVVGRHTVKGGIWLQKSLKDQTAFTAVNGDIWFSHNDSLMPGNTGWAFANAAVGNFQRLAQTDKVRNGQYRYWNVEWFAQDSWRVTDRLTVDFGMRFYYIQPQYDAALQTSSFNPALYDPSKKAVLMQPVLNSAGQRVAMNPVNGQLYPGSYIGSIVNTGNGFVNGLYANGMGLAGQNYPKGLIDGRGIHYAPRLGIAWKAMDKTVVRVGFGTFYDRFQGNPVFDMLPNPPSTTRPTFYYGSLAEIGSLQGVFFPSDVRGFDKGGHVPTTYNWNFSIQREVARGTLLDVAYVGSRSNHLLGRTDYNALPFGSAWLPQNQEPTNANPTYDGNTTKPVNLYRPYQGFGSQQLTTFGAMSNYNALQVNLTRNLARNFLFGVAYTWSKALGTASADGDLLHPTNFRMANYSYLNQDVPHILSFNYQYTLPSVGKNGNWADNWAGRAVLNGWQFSGLTLITAGQPSNISLEFVNPTLNGVGMNRVFTGSETFGPRVVVTGNPDNGPKSGDTTFIDTSVFRPPSVGSQGLESAQRIVRRPGINNWDISLFKNVYLGHAESRFIQLRFEMFNAPNHTQFSDFNRTVQFVRATGQINNLPTSLGGGGGRYGFGAITVARDPRIIQLAAKIYF